MSEFPTTGSLFEENLKNSSPNPEGVAEGSSIIPTASYSNTAKGSPLQGVNAEKSEEPLASAGLAVPPTEERADKTQSPSTEDDKIGLGDVAGDMGLFALRGVEGFAESVAGLFGSKWDREDWSVFGKSKTVVGSFGENLVQFGIGLIPGLGTAGWVSKAAKLNKGSKLAKRASTLRKARAQKSLGHQAAFSGKVPAPIAPLAKGNRSLDIKTLKRLAKMKKTAKTAAIWGYAGAVSDFVAFKGQEARLSNLLQGMGVENDLVQYLAYDPTQDSSEMEERLKNVIEGGIVGTAVGGVIDIAGRAGAFKFIGKSIGKIRRKNQLVHEGMDEAEAIEKAEREFVEAVSDDPEMLREMADFEAQMKHEQYLRDNGALPAPARLGGDELPFGGNEDTLDVWYGAGQNKELSNLAPRPFTYEGKEYKSVEHAYQTLKSGRFDDATYSNPAWNRGGVKIRGKLQADKETNVGLMERLIRESFEQNPEASQALLKTKGKTLTHLRDRSIWRDKFPEALTKVRSELEAKQPKEAPPARVEEPSGPTMHSGGASGADTVFQEMAEKAGMNVKAHSFRGHAAGNKRRVEHTPEELKEANEHLKRANKTLKRKFPAGSAYVNNLLRRNYFQVKDVDQVVAVGRIENGQVQGGTAWATQMGVDMGKEVHVFDMNTNSWHFWDGTTWGKSGDGKRPILSDSFAGIGSRNLSDEGKEAIQNLFKDSAFIKRRKAAHTSAQSAAGRQLTSLGEKPQETSSKIVPVSDPDAISVMRGPQGRHMNNTKPGEPGWLGNPFKWKGNGGKGTVEESIAKFKQAFLKRIEEDPAFKAELEGIVGRKLGYYKPKAEKSHAQVIKAWLDEAGVSKTPRRGFKPTNTYTGLVDKLKENQVFVFTSNHRGFHGAGSAGYASFNVSGNRWREMGYGELPDGTQGKWNVKGQGEGLQKGTEGESYALPTVTKPGAKKSIPEEELVSNIRKMYETARANPEKEFLVAQSAKKGLSGWSGDDMARMYHAAGEVPDNVKFEQRFGAKIDNQSRKGIDEFPVGGAGGEAPKKLPLPKIKGEDATVDMVDDLSEAELNEFLSEFGDLDIPSVAGALSTKRQIAKDIIEAGEHTGEVIADIEGLVTKVVSEAGDDFLTGTGDQAILAGRKLLSGVHSNEGLVALVRVLARKAVEKRHDLHGPSRNAEETFDRVEKSLVDKDHWDVFDRDLVHQRLEQARGNVDALERIYAEQDMIHKLYTTLAEEVGESVKRAEKAKKTKGTVTFDIMEDGVAKQAVYGYEELLTEVYSNLDKFLAVKELWAEYGTHLSLGMLQRKFIYEGTGTRGITRRKDLGFRPKMKGVDYDQSMERRAYMQGVRGSRSQRQFLAELRQATNASDLEAALGKIGKDSRNGFARTMGWYLNALLSNPVTWGVNMVGSAIMKGFRDFEVIAGSMAQFAHTGNADLLRTRIKAIYDMESFMEAWKYAAISLKEGEPRSIAGHTAYSDNRFEDMKSGWHFGDGDDPLTRAGNWFGNLVSGPSRVLMAGDEFFKQWNYRSYVKADLAMEAHRRGIKDPYEIASYVRDSFESHMTKEGRIANEANVYKEAAQAADDNGLRFGKRASFIDEYMDEHFYENNLRLDDGFVYRTTEQRDLLVNRATDWALVNTFTNNPSHPFARWVSKTAMAHPWLSFAIPFVRTPTNILTFAMSRVIPLPGWGKAHQAFDVQDVLDKRGRPGGYGALSLNPNRFTVGSEQAIMNTNRYAKAARGQDTGMELPADARERYENSEWNEPVVKREEIPLKKADGRHQAPAFIRYDEGPTGTIHIDEARIKEMYDRKAWRADGPNVVPGVKPLDDKHFKTPEDFENFVMEHEKAHQYLRQRKRENESKGDYENRVNQEALKRLEFKKNHGSGWQKQLKEQYGDMPFSEAMAKEHLHAQAQAGAVAAAEHHGRLTTAAMMTASSLYTIELIQERITGSPPESRAAKAAWDAAGKRPWSILVGEGEDAKWVSYQRMDPFATIIGIFADIVHMTPALAGEDEAMGMIATDSEIEDGMQAMSKVAAIISMTFTNNITNGSYVEGLYETMETFKDLTKAPEFLAKIASGFVPTGLTWTENLVEKDPQIYEARKLLDHVMKKVPTYMRPDMPETPVTSARLEPRRNWLGEKIKKTGPFLPSFIGLGQQVPSSTDPVDLELLSIGKGFLQRPSIWSGVLDTKKFRNTNGGQSAYDRHQELLSTMNLGGRTARQSIRALIESPKYQALPPATDMTIGKTHPRQRAIAKILNFYSDHAKNQVMEEYPELRQAYYQTLQQ